METVKHDKNKPRWSLMPREIWEVVQVLEFGALKYGVRNWEGGTSWTRFYDAIHRHLQAWASGEDNDPETGLSHLAHAICCALFLLAYRRRKLGTDDRP
jgi:hypothetical protein